MIKNNRYNILSVLTLILVFVATKKAKSIEPKYIPYGFNFSMERDVLQHDTNNALTLRKHSWAGMITSSNSHYQSMLLPIWETRLGAKQVFTSLQKPQKKKLNRDLFSLNQFYHLGLKSLYHVKLTKQKAKGLNSAQSMTFSARKYHHAILLAMHVKTKEIKNGA